MIPRVKTWHVYLVDGRIETILGPTRLLAQLNYREQTKDYSEIQCVIPVRKNPTKQNKNQKDI